MQWSDADRIISACADKICENEDFVRMARTSSMSDLGAVFRDAMMDALVGILSDGAEMCDAFSGDPATFERIMGDELLPLVYRRCRAE